MRERERNVFTNSFDSPYTYRIIPSRFDTISKQSPRHSRSVVDGWCTVSVKASRFHPEKKERERERSCSLGGRLSWRRTSGFRARVKRIVDRRRGKLRHARNIEQRNNGDSGPPFDERRVPISNLPFREKGGKWYLDLVFEDCPHVTEPNRRLVYPDVRFKYAWSWPMRRIVARLRLRIFWIPPSPFVFSSRSLEIFWLLGKKWNELRKGVYRSICNL